MESKKYAITYLSNFISQFNNILYYITYKLQNKIAAENLYNEVVKQIEKRSENPEDFEIFKKTKNEKVNWYRIQVKRYTIFYIVIDNTMEVRRIYYSKRNFKKLI